MRRTATLAAVTLLALALPTVADAQLPEHRVPKTAKKMTLELAYNASDNKALAEAEAQGPDERGKYPSAATYDCKVTSRRRGTCKYRISTDLKDESGYYRLTHTCYRNTVVRLIGKRKRVRTSVEKLGCETTP